MQNSIAKNPIYLFYKRVYEETLSGKLVVKTLSSERKLYFLKGKIVFAKTSVIQERLGEILFKQKLINQDKFLNIQSYINSSNKKIGEILEGEGIINRQELDKSLSDQLLEIAVACFSLITGEWEFHEGENFIVDTSGKIDMRVVFLKGIKGHPNLSHFINSYSCFDVNINQTYKKSASKQFKEFLDNLENTKESDLQEVATRLEMSQETFWKNMLYLYLRGAISFSEKGVQSSEKSKQIEELLNLYEQIKGGRIDHYQIFGLDSNATSAKIKEAYLVAAKKFHPDRIGSVPDPNIQEQVNFVFANINSAYEILSDKDKKGAYDDSLRGTNFGKVNVEENLNEKASNLYKKAKMYMKERKYWEAASYMEEAVRMSNNEKASYYLLLGTCQSYITQYKLAAEKNLTKAAALEPWNSEPYIILGNLFYKDNFLKRAEGFYRKALSIDPDNKLVRKRLEEVAPSKKSFSFSSLFNKKK